MTVLISAGLSRIEPRFADGVGVAAGVFGAGAAAGVLGFGDGVGLGPLGDEHRYHHDRDDDR